MELKDLLKLIRVDGESNLYIQLYFSKILLKIYLI